MKASIGRFLIFISTILIHHISCVGAQRGVMGGSRSGGYEDLDLNGKEKLSGSTEDVYDIVRCDKTYSIPPIDVKELVSKLGKEQREAAQYIADSLGRDNLNVKFRIKPIAKNRENNDGRFHAFATLGSFTKANFKTKSQQKNFRIVWGTGITKPQKTDLKDMLTMSYDDALFNRDQLPLIDVEVILPKAKCCKGRSPLIHYVFPYGPSTFGQERVRVALSKGIVTVYPNGRKNRTNNGKDGGVKIGLSSLHVHAGTSIVDRGWSKGRKLFWKGRQPGQIK